MGGLLSKNTPMHLTKKDLQQTEKIKRLNIVNSITGVKPANLIGSQSPQGATNLAIFSSLVHLGSNPALLGFITRPTGEVKRHTLANIEANGYYTINHVLQSQIKQAHQTSAKYPKDQSEFKTCGFKPEYIEGFSAPFVSESKIKIGLRWEQTIPIELNNTSMVIGSIEHIIVPDESLTQEGYLNLAQAETVGISGLNSYYRLSFLQSFPYARP